MRHETEFLLARIAEDKAVAQATQDAHDPLIWDAADYADPKAWGIGGPVDGPSGYAAVVIDPARVLAECEAKRQIVEMAQAIGQQSPDRGRRDVALATVRLLALPYADHPDYRPEWRT